jgi:hypothetical protein
MGRLNGELDGVGMKRGRNRTGELSIGNSAYDSRRQQSSWLPLAISIFTRYTDTSSSICTVCTHDMYSSYILRHISVSCFVDSTSGVKRHFEKQA